MGTTEQGELPPMAQVLVPLPRPSGVVSIDDRSPLDLRHGCRVAVEGAAAAGVGAHLREDLARVIGGSNNGPPDDAPEVLLVLEPERDFPAEGYHLRVDAGGALIEAGDVAGLARGAATFRQLIDRHTGAAIAADITDAPRYGWRGLLLDTVRHFMPLDAIRRTIDAMALGKLNVLHLHLTDDQAWRVQSRAHPELTERAAPGGHYTLAELADLVHYATDRGVRIVPELDVPGHTSALLFARPDLALGDAPASIPTSFVVPNVCVDPENEAVYSLLATVLGEWAEVFSDAFVHIGGDEVPVLGADRQAVFTERVVALVRANDRVPIVWDEALHPSLAADVVVQAWRSPAKLHEALQAGHRTILSAGWYLDLGVPLRFLHAVEPSAPLPVISEQVLAPWQDRATTPRLIGSLAEAVVRDASEIDLDAGPTLPPDQQERILGGEACLWAERVSPELLDGFLWPAVHVVGDRLWSPPDALAALDPRLVEDRFDLFPAVRTWTDVQPLGGRRAVLVSLADLGVETVGNPDVRESVSLALAALADWCEPVRWYARATAGWPAANGRSHDAPIPGTDQPLDRFVDALVPEASGPREWRRRPSIAPVAGDAHALVDIWRAPAASLARCLRDSSPQERGELGEGLSLGEDLPSRLREPLGLAKQLAAAAELLRIVLAATTEGRASIVELDDQIDALERPVGEANIAVRRVFAAVRGADSLTG